MSSLTTLWMSTENEPHVNKTKKENKFLWIPSGNHLPARRFQLILKINIFQKYLICSQLPKKTSSTFRHILSCNCHRKAWCRCRRLPLEGESLIQERCYFFLLHQCVRYFAIVCDTSPLCAIYYHKSLTLTTDWGGVSESGVVVWHYWRVAIKCNFAMLHYFSSFAFVCLGRNNMENYVFLLSRCCFGVPILCKASPL